ncbi:phosphatase PAP2 family protein [Acidihalobacter ferrooxydans]|uniref:undecaprenyl-diphosphate phosphatase n=1 Tax=Acidihalobacter ferrooxydans TaxID=1765967 RepID=A0A1P8UIP4_9GAMM|nr:phosphatase PAP2 family protein [Acidihalobacter ferrooxydans]APZ43706.1 phosphatase PAP2 family protein [Acidihalobacter ferrooxydans]
MRLLDRLTRADQRTTVLFNRINHCRIPARLFAVVSRLGNGVLWYCIILALPLVEGVVAVRVSLQMVAVGLVSYLLYRWLKRSTGRARPCQAHDGVLHSVAPLDEFSFPSGHTMHAVAFTIILLASYPAWGLAVAPFTVLVALSRMVLGLHYPSDVIAGALIGALMATFSIVLMGAVQ